jgi:hypothetical protein
MAPMTASFVRTKEWPCKVLEGWVCVHWHADERRALGCAGELAGHVLVRLNGGRVQEGWFECVAKCCSAGIACLGEEGRWGVDLNEELGSAGGRASKWSKRKLKCSLQMNLQMETLLILHSSRA